MKRLVVMGVLFSLVLAGVGLVPVSFGDEKSPDKKPADKKAADKKAPGNKAADKTDAGAAGNVSVKIVDWEETLEIVASHKGKIVVLDAWSTSCQPCMKEFPNLVKLHKRYADKGVVCMSLSCDYQGIKNKPPAFYRERVIKFLEKQGAVFQNLMSSVEAEELFEMMEVASIPAVFVFGRDGELHKRFDNEQAKTEEDNFTYADVNRLVDELLAAK
ncbi:MAG TPA: TlpA disulfide reductase family protein [Planctomycetaceae bacterium]|nr:TlpA disulfide reductase family protein [Planctomycetaceae bacterium]